MSFMDRRIRAKNPGGFLALNGDSTSSSVAVVLIFPSKEEGSEVLR